MIEPNEAQANGGRKTPKKIEYCINQAQVKSPQTASPYINKHRYMFVTFSCALLARPLLILFLFGIAWKDLSIVLFESTAKEKHPKKYSLNPSVRTSKPQFYDWDDPSISENHLHLWFLIPDFFFLQNSHAVFWNLAQGSFQGNPSCTPPPPRSYPPQK